jgi:tetratricopeptide (TPR) repeat protein
MRPADKENENKHASLNEEDLDSSSVFESESLYRTHAEWVAMGDLFYRDKSFGTARACYDNALKIKPTDDRSLVKLAECTLETKGENEVLNLLESWPDDERHNKIISVVLIRIFRARQVDAIEVDELMERILSQYPNNSLILQEYAVYLYDCERYTEAIPILEQLADLAPGYSAYSLLYSCYEKTGNRDKLEYLDSKIKSLPEYRQEHELNRRIESGRRHLEALLILGDGTDSDSEEGDI